MDYEGEKFLLKLYKDLYNKEEVRFADFRSGKKSGTKYELIRKYLERLERQEKVFDGEHENLENFLKERYYEAYVIREEDIPESYWAHQKQVALERGYGHITYTNDLKHKDANIIIKDQKKSLEKWINYLMKENTSYPMWARYWAFQGMLKLGEYDKEKKIYKRRTNGTTSPFIELDAEALAKTIEVIEKYVKDKSIDDKDLEKLIGTGSFEKIYAYHITKLNEIRKSNISKSESEEGIWIKYKKGDEQKVVQSLDGKGTGWCIAGQEMAKNYLETGTLTIYYTKDENGEYTRPRACIRTDHGNIAEVRGIEKDQNMESQMFDIVDKKLDEYPDKETYKKKVRDMRKVTEIHNKRINRNEELTIEDLRFLYEFDEKIEGFGWDDDPRIDEIKKTIVIGDKKFAMEAIEKGSRVLEYSSKELKNDRKVVLAAINQYAYDIAFVGEELRNDKEIVSAAVSRKGFALAYASEELKNDREIILIAVSEDGRVLEYANEELRNDREIVLAAVNDYGLSLRFASEALKDDKEVVLAAIKNDGLALKYASDKLKNDKKIILVAIKNHGGALGCASEALKDDKEVVLAAVTRDGLVLEYASERLKNDREVALTAIKNNGMALKYVSKELKNDKKIVLAAVKNHGGALRYASEALKNDRMVVSVAVRTYGFALEYASERLKRDRIIAWIAGVKADELKQDDELDADQTMKI